MKGKKLLSVLLTLALVLSFVPVAFAANFADTKGHWAEAAIERWSGYGIVNGDERGFRPNDTMTRAEAATVFAKLFALSDGSATKTTYPDLTADKWYYEAMNKCINAGIMNGMDGMANGDGTMTREMFFVMFARALGLKEQDTTKGLPADGAAWSAKWINALTDRGFVQGMDGKVNATGQINRASVMTLLNQTISVYANEDGKTYTGTGKGVMLVTANECTVTGKIDTLVIAGGEDEAAAVAAAVNADGSITSNLVLAAAKKSIKIENATIADVNVVAPANVSVGEGTTVETISVSEQAEEVAVAVEEGAKVETVETQAETTEISGAGEVAKVEATGAAAAEDAKVEVSTPNTEIKAVASAENADGSKTVTITESKNDAQGASTGATKTETTVKETVAADGTKTTETKVEETKTNAAGVVTSATTTEVKATENTDGSKVEEAKQTVTDANGRTTTTEGTVTTAANGTTTTTGNNMSAAIAATETATAAAEAATGESLTSETPASSDSGSGSDSQQSGGTSGGTSGSSGGSGGGGGGVPVSYNFETQISSAIDTALTSINSQISNASARRNSTTANQIDVTFGDKTNVQEVDLIADTIAAAIRDYVRSYGSYGAITITDAKKTDSPASLTASDSTNRSNVANFVKALTTDGTSTLASLTTLSELTDKSVQVRVTQADQSSVTYTIVFPTASGSAAA